MSLAEQLIENLINEAKMQKIKDAVRTLDSMYNQRVSELGSKGWYTAVPGEKPTPKLDKAAMEWANQFKKLVDLGNKLPSEVKDFYLM